MFQRAASSVVEHLTFNQGVPGSIPGRPTILGIVRQLAFHVALTSTPTGVLTPVGVRRSCTNVSSQP